MKLIKLNRIYKTKNSGLYEAQIDDEDEILINQYNWQVDIRSYTIYATTDQIPGQTKTYMHILIAQPPIGYDVHHIDNNGLNNQKENFEILTRSQHNMNMRIHSDKLGSRYKGVYFEKRTGRYYAQICKNYRTINFGTFSTQEKAKEAYDKAAKEIIS